jgi:hypothetical protein
VAHDWFESVSAPRKAFETLPGASHNTLAFHDELLRLLKKDVLPVV